MPPGNALAIARYERGDLENGEAVLDIRTV
jgi:hypothetical protein